MKDSVLLHRKGKPRRPGESIPEAWDVWNKTAELARQSDRSDLVQKYQPDRGAGYMTIYFAVRKLREELGQ